MDEPEEVKEFTEKIEEFVEDCVGNYKPLVPERTKVIHDPVWGTHVFSPAEIAFIDSPLIQRLRFIHQTGLAFYTYPSANHTRFEHSLGTMSVVTKMADKLNEKAENTVTDPNLKRLRLAALFHDCGHGVFSHISEDMYRDHKWIRKLIGREEFTQAEPKPHELLSYFIVKSRAFKIYFEEILSHYERKLFREIKQDQIADLILGRPVEGLSYLGKMINGPFDADKIDYIVRDSYFIGLPMTVDIERLFYAINPEPIAENKEGNGEIHLVAHSSGISAIEEIISNKIRLFDRLYHHPKVRAADRMMYNFMRYAKDNIGEVKDISEIICINPIDYLQCSEKTFMDISKKESKTEKSPIMKFVNRLKFRDLPMKALVISAKTVNSNDQMYNLQNERKRDDWEDVQFAIQRRILNDVPEELLDGLTAYDIIVDIPKPPQLNEAKISYVKLGRHSKAKPLSELFPLAQEWLNAYVINKWHGHVFCPNKPQKLREKIFKISREVLANSPALNLQVNDNAYELTNMDDYPD